MLLLLAAEAEATVVVDLEDEAPNDDAAVSIALVTVSYERSMPVFAPPPPPLLLDFLPPRGFEELVDVERR